MRLPRVAPPILQTSEEARHATWLELFFDLVFVVAVAELAHDLAADVTGLRLVAFVGLFVPVFLVWMNFSYYADLFGEEGAGRIGLFLAMFGVAALATTLHDALAGQLGSFIVAYLALRVVLLALYWQAWRANPTVREFTGRYLTLYGLGALFWVSGLFVTGTLQFTLIGIGIVIEVATPAATYFTVTERPQQISHMPERFGLFTIIVLGEVVVAVISGIADTEWSVPAVVTAAAAFLLAVSFWRIYFAHVREETITDLVRGEFDFFAGMGYTYGHFGVALGITATGAGALVAIVAAGESGSLTLLERLTFGGGVASFLLGASVTHGAVDAVERRTVGEWLVGAAAILVVTVFLSTPAPFVLLVTGVLVALAGRDLRWVTRPTPPADEAPSR
ncbi:low temperature requirement protein A [Haloferax namakaokahaiae]|uniref:Low temperature requirement protein A n=1 Tax=Haloferax namakaokahaiae TaxID=1748331 RepID=A0ABD5ZF84_9EURY